MCGPVRRGHAPVITTPDFIVVNPFVSYRRRIGSLNGSFLLDVSNVFNDDTDPGNGCTCTRYTEPQNFISTFMGEF